MNLDATFRPFVIAGFWLVILIAVPFRIRSQSTGEKLDRTQEGLAMMVILRLVGLAVWTGVIAFMIDPTLMTWSSLRLPAATRWAGVALTMITAGLLLWTLRSLGPNLTDTVVTRAAHTLVTRGPYRWVRHPFYDCMALFVVSVALMMANWFVILGGGIMFVLLAIRARTEEQKLLQRFGEPYRAYRAATGRFLPKITAIVVLSLITTTSVSASGREGEGIADAVLLIVQIVVTAFIVVVGAGGVLGAVRAIRRGESVLKGGGYGLLTGLAAFGTLGIVTFGAVTVVGSLWLAYAVVWGALQ